MFGGLSMYKDIGIVSMARTAVGSFGGSLSTKSAVDMGAVVIKEAMERSGIATELVEDVIMGCVGQYGKNVFLGRLAGQQAGLPQNIGGQTVNRMCASGLQAITTAADVIHAGHGSVIVAGGAESMSNFPHSTQSIRKGLRMGDVKLQDDLLTSALIEPFTDKHIGTTAENIAKKYGFTRTELDTYAMESQRRAAEAIRANKFKEEIVSIEVRNKKQTIIFDADEFPRETSMESLAKLRPCFVDDGLLTAGSASGINDGAAAVVVADLTKVNAKPLARILDYAVAGVDPAYMGLGPVDATKKLLDKTGLSIKDIGLAELNEAFASQALACIKDIGIDPAITNVNGSGISLGHPLGATGTIISIRLINEMRKRKVRYGLAALCIGGGQGMAALFEVSEND